MKVFVVLLFCCLAVVSTQDNHCYTIIGNSCSTDPSDSVDNNNIKDETCNAVFGRGHTYMHYLNTYVNQHISRSMQYLLMSTYFGFYQQSREGFEKLYRKLSDETWEDAIELMQYITMRGGVVDLKPYIVNDPNSAVQHKDVNILDKEAIMLHELESLGKAVEIQKELAVQAHTIYNHTNIHDPEMGSYVEDKFMHKQAKTVRTLVGLANDLKRLVDTKVTGSSVGLQYFILDEYLKKYM